MSSPAYPKGERDNPALLEQFNDRFVKDGPGFGLIEMQTDKATVKVVPCTGCGQPLGVNVFYAPAIAKCASCGGQAAIAGTGESVIVQAGRTDPSKAANLADCLINREFAEAVCPKCGEATELKSVTHNPKYGPSRIVGHKGGVPVYRNDVGESVMHQCNSCRTTITMSTTHQVFYRRQNEPKPNAGRPSAWNWMLGERAAS